MIQFPLRNTIFVLFFLIVGLPSLQATHIIGGEMNYKCLGNNTYEIALTVYRDCYLGEALMDDTAYVAVYDINNTLVQTLPILLGEVDTIFQSDECLIIPPNICVEATTYIDTITLLPKIGGYEIAYQRCCRNETILNIIDPLNRGATYNIHLSETAMRACNSSPVVEHWPPTFVCVNRPLNFNHQAYDTDGDSIAYRLCTPLDGGISIIEPRPRPAAPPPYQPIIWNTPTYDLNNVLGGLPLKIDPTTGIITGMPNIIGQFVVGVCVDEYRDGVLLSSTRRDFEYNVVPCEDVTAQFDLPVSQCENLTITPANQTGGEPSDFLWKFLDKDQRLLGIATEQFPSFTFPDTGTYSVRLLVNTNSICVDSTEKSIALQPNALSADFNYNVLGCADSLELQFTNKSVNPLGNIDQWQWTIQGTFDQLVSTEENPKITLTKSQVLEVTLQVYTDNGCMAETRKELNAMVIPDSFSVSAYDTLILCKGDSIELNPIFNPNLTYSWSPPNGLSAINAPNPKAFPDSSTAYVVMIRDSGGNCELRKNVFLEVIDFDNSFDFDYTIVNCGDSATVQLAPKTGYDLTDITLLWEINYGAKADFYTTEAPTFTIRNDETVTMSATAMDRFGCSKTVHKTTRIALIQETIAPLFTFCKGDSVELNPDFNPDYTYEWFPKALFADPTLPNPTITAEIPTDVHVKISDSTGVCSVERTTQLFVLNTIPFADFDIAVNHCIDSLVLEITNISTQPFGLEKDVKWELVGTVDTLTSIALKPTFTLQNSQAIELTLTIDTAGSCPKIVSKSFQFDVLENIELDKEVIICQGERIALNPKETSLNYVYEWSPSEGLNNSKAANPIAQPNKSTTYTLTVSDSARWCSIEKQVMVTVKDTLPPLEAVFQVRCDGKTVEISPNSDALIRYDFGDNSTLLDTATTQIVSHSYENSGTYEILLSYSSSTVCPDTARLNINLPEKSFNVAADWNVESCENNVATLELIDLTANNVGTITTWNWYLSNGLSSTEIEPAFSIKNNEALTAKLVITLDNDSNCQDSTSLEIPPLLVEPLALDTLIACAETAVALNPTFNPTYTHLWSPKEIIDENNAPNPTVLIRDTQQYFVQISNEYGCAILDSLLTFPAPKIEISTLEIPVVCDTSEVVLFAESDQTNELFWQNENGDTLGVEPELLVEINQTELFTATFTDSYNCQNTATVGVNFQPILLRFENAQPTCTQQEKTLTIQNLRPNEALDVSWSPSTSIIANETTINPTVMPTEPTTYVFSAKNAAGCNLQGSIFVDTLPLPTVIATADPSTIFNGETTQLNATENPTYKYKWLPSESLDDAMLQNPIARPTETTTYMVEVKDENDCVNTTDITVNVQTGVCDFPYIFVPSGFTPNNDGENDRLYVRGTYIENLTFKVYDRWGNKVFETTDQSIGWDGTHNGKPLPTGVFGYYLSAICYDGTVFSQQGNVTLIR